MKKQEKILHFKVLIEQDENGWYIADVPELSGCHTQGKTLEEVRKRIREAIELVLETDKDLLEEKKGQKDSPFTFFGIEDVTIRYA